MSQQRERGPSAGTPARARVDRLAVLAIAFPIAIALGVLGVMAWQSATARSPTEAEDALYAGVRDVEHPAIDEVWQEGDTGHTVFFDLSRAATDRDARDVWCDIVGEDAIRRRVSVGVQSGPREWLPPQGAQTRTTRPRRDSSSASQGANTSKPPTHAVGVSGW